MIMNLSSTMHIAAQAIYYDVAALNACCKYIKNNQIKHPIVYIMACRIGPFAGHFYKEIHKLGGTVFLNPDGHEWMRKNGLHRFANIGRFQSR